MNLQHAIDRSIARNEIVHLEVANVQAALEQISQIWDGEIDYVWPAGEDEYGTRFADVWGWTDETPENEQDFRICLRQYGGDPQ